MQQVAQPAQVPADLFVDTEGNYEPYTYWLETCGLHDFYSYARDLIGDVTGRSLMDAGCGIGNTAVMFARRGARVSAFDVDDEVLRKADEIAAANGVNVAYSKQWFETLDYPDGHFDVAFGALVIHHVGIAEAGRQLGRVLKPGGKAVFIENSARNPLLMLVRSHVVGRFGVPKYGDDDEEHPLRADEIETLRQSFPGTVKLHFPALVLFRLVDFYVFRRRSKVMTAILRGLDRGLGALPLMRRLSYFQILEFQKD